MTDLEEIIFSENNENIFESCLEYRQRHSKEDITSELSNRSDLWKILIFEPKDDDYPEAIRENQFIAKTWKKSINLMYGLLHDSLTEVSTDLIHVEVSDEGKKTFASWMMNIPTEYQDFGEQNCEDLPQDFNTFVYVLPLLMTKSLKGNIDGYLQTQINQLAGLENSKSYLTEDEDDIRIPLINSLVTWKDNLEISKKLLTILSNL